MNEIYTKTKIVSRNEMEKLTKTHEYTLLAVLTVDKYLIRYGRLLTRDLLEIVGEKLIPWNKKRGVRSSIQIAAAVTGYARISINKYKNIKDNDCVYTDTDSVSLT
ncbi:hypothetical protein BB561_000012 [Smittium simulii]|uniref:DNA-directed DNA polymerase n=1 Tax=Smittium simulii TaxID=133385 RepID=A0A2T9Z128_9FUNG|nr:hypothetical protein BB561_000012 [Smittium simulii]